MKRFLQTLDRSLFFFLLLLLVWLPLPVGSNRDWAVALFALMTSLLAASWLVLQLLQKRRLSRNLRHAKWPLLLLGLTQVWVIAQLVLGISVDSGASFQYLVLGTAYGFLYLLIVGLVKTRRRLNMLLGTLVCSGAFQAFYGSFMTLSGIEYLLFTEKTFHLGHATGTYVNRNHLAGYLELTIACGIGLLLALRDSREFRWTYLLETMMGPKGRLRLALVGMVVALVMTHSRMGNAAFFTSLMIVGAVFVMIDKQNRRRNGLILASVLLIDTLVVSQFFGLEKLKNRIVETRLHDVIVDGRLVEKANELRGDVFTQAVLLAQEKPLVGKGAGSFEAAFPVYGGNLPLHFDHAHNDFLQFLIEYGIIGTLPLLGFVCLSLWYALAAMRRQQSLYRSGVGFGSAMAILALMIHSFTDFNLQIPANAATFVVVCALAVVANHHRAPVGKRRSAEIKASTEGLAITRMPRVLA
ncbi:O-antigen ligase family protein [Pseudomonas matsuisoli]|uniref:Polymerase n=1 Tax=Pseudomonas matsuisoli TaxID=1515666 RepID=A0A917PV15_9PSED|nr:O-antigen ligase family protein [Pseudomonas matsuisoli]GGJ93194.1 polymerase [Pseudomonas matsuisoli]